MAQFSVRLYCEVEEVTKKLKMGCFLRTYVCRDVRGGFQTWNMSFL